MNDFSQTTSVIIPCWNQLEFTRLCISALVQHTRAVWELIVIDNGSTDETAVYLADVRDTLPIPVTIISNNRNRGFPVAINQGLECARGENLVLLNNDAVVTDGWLDQLIALTKVRPAAQNPNTQSRNPKPEAQNPKTESTASSFEFGSSNFASKIGLVGPMSNYATAPQLVENVPYRDLNDMHRFAHCWRDQNRGKWMRVPKLSGFCLLMTRSTYKAIGGLDTRFGLGFFDDDDLALRARQAGFDLAIALDLFVHHFGSRTFVGNGIDAARLLDENAAKFAAKWGDRAPQGQRVSLQPFPSAQAPQPTAEPRNTVVPNQPTNPALHFVATSAPAPVHQPIEPAQPSTESARTSQRARVSLNLIVRDEEANLPKCLRSVAGLFDEIVVVDTGSRDRTVEIARQFDARVFHFTWIDDFAAARNAALEHATGDYVFWLDADDVVEPPERAKLTALLQSLRVPLHQSDEPNDNRLTSPAARRNRSPFACAFVVRCACDPAPGSVGGDTVVDHVRLFPLMDGVRWTYKVHEQILPSLRRAGVQVKWSDVTVRHTGYVDRDLRVRKLERDIRILHGELAERPSDPFVLFNLGMIAVERKQWRPALDYLNRSLAGSAPTDSITRKLYALIARVHENLGDLASALQVCEKGLAQDGEDAELWFRKGMAHRHRAEPAEAERAWRKILTLRRPEKFSSVDQGIFGHVTRRNLAALAQERGDHEEARRLWQAILAECPGDRDALRYLNPGPA